MKNVLLVFLTICSLPALFLISIPVTDPLLSKPFDPRLPHFVLLVWPDHVEIRQIKSISEVSPRPLHADYVFNIPPERVAWVEEQVRKLPPPSPAPDFGWLIRIRQVTHNRQRIQLEAWWKDDFRGLIYEATPNEIVPLKSRSGGIGYATELGLVDFFVWCGGWITIGLIRGLVAKRS